ncbi:MAG: hypothetical protein CO022_02365 [Flavobacteriales bacterium CG_4_9_14_0_2_um_filter_32_27]|nr:MAG: hypothetical protein CO022_02365 [Flavobacteriales bacterium CG_4_9_14_0_2_um_filter_32_27]
MILKKKSESSIGAAKALNEINYYSSSVHCSYYSCLQLIKHILLHKYKKSEDELRNEQEKSGKPSHEYLINSILIKIRDVSPINFRDVSRELPALKMARIDADYKEIEIKKGMSEDAFDKATELLTTLNMAFKI